MIPIQSVNFERHDGVPADLLQKGQYGKIRGFFNNNSTVAVFRCPTCGCIMVLGKQYRITTGGMVFPTVTHIKHGCRFQARVFLNDWDIDEILAEQVDNVEDSSIIEDVEPDDL